MNISMSEPVLVERSRWYCWFPSLIRLPNGHLWATMSILPDVHVSSSAIALKRSRDGGRTWEEAKYVVDGGYSHLVLPDGSALLLPYNLRASGNSLVAPCNRILPSGELIYDQEGVVVEGWPKRPAFHRPQLGVCAFVFNGQTVPSQDGAYLTTLYGKFEGDQRYSLVLAASADGRRWSVRSIIAGPDCPLEGQEGPCESAICRLKDRRLMCVFRLASFVPYGQCWSEDNGHTWTEPVAMSAGSVEPSLQVMANGAVVLSGGRPGIFVWVNADGTGRSWQPVDIVAHHNACCGEKDRICSDSGPAWNPRGELLARGLCGFSSCYTELARIDENALILIYDRLGLGWHEIPDESNETNSVWTIRMMLNP